MRILFLLLAALGLVFAQGKPGWKISLKPVGTPSASAEAPFQVILRDSKGAPVEGAQVELVLTMIDMDHGETKVPLQHVKAGVYEGKARFLMGGGWNVDVRARKGGQSASQKFKYNVKD
jgi:nitrogen fixation protein FixH